MQISKNKTAAIAIAIFFILSMTASTMLLPTTNAHSPAWTIPTYAFVTAAPNPIGIGQYTTIVMWLDQIPLTGSGVYGDRWEGYKLEITKPDGSKEIIGPFTCESPTANAWVQYAPDQVGKYTIVFSWPGQTLANGTGTPSANALRYVGDYFAGSTSEPSTLIVQQEPIKDWLEPPLPTEYWTRPINAANRGWSQLASNWLKGGQLIDAGLSQAGAYPVFQTKGTAPESPHILWVKPIGPGTSGGINDAHWPGISSDQGWSAPIIMNGKIYYNAPQYGYYCLNLRTGEEIWYKNGTDNGLNGEVKSLTQGQLFHFDSSLTQTVHSFLISVSGSTWYFLDPATGDYIAKIINVPSGGVAVTDVDGSLLLYSYNSNTGNLLCWNDTQAIPPSGPTGANQVTWSLKQGATIDAVNDRTWFNAGPTATAGWDDIQPRSGYTMNVTIEKGLCPIWHVLRDDNSVPKMIMGMTFTNGDTTLSPGMSGATGRSPGGTSDTFTAWLVTIDDHVAPYSPFPSKTYTQNNNLGFGATLLWNKNFTVPIPDKNYTWKFADENYDSQTFVLHCKQTRQLWGYSLKTGEMLWGPTPAEGVMNFYDTGLSELADMTRTYYGLTIQSGIAGTLYAYNATTGKLVWTYNGTSIGHESPYGENYPLSFAGVCDGKIYLYTNEHTPTKPLFRGSYIRCINATDGTEMWKLLNWNKGLSIADGSIVNMNLYDNLIYCIGQGQTATTVTAPDTVQPLGTSVLLKGTVTDQSPGAKGTPAIADANMQAWMEYLYEQQAMPTNAKGVEVTLDTIDPNGNFVHIGTVTSDTSGKFRYMWTPEISGSYSVIATFAGSKSYYSSTAETAMGVSEAAPTASPYPVVNLPPTEMYIAAAAAAIIVAIAIVGVLILTAVRKRP